MKTAEEKKKLEAKKSSNRKNGALKIVTSIGMVALAILTGKRFN